MDISNYVINFVKYHGYEGVFLVGFTQSVIQPMPVLPFIIMSKQLGLNPILVSIIGVISNVLGAIVSYWLGYFLGENVGKRILSEKQFLKARAFFDRFGIWAILIGEPYKAICWIGGILRFNFYKYIIMTSISRVLHTALYLMLSHAINNIF